MINLRNVKPEEEKYYALANFEYFCDRYFGIKLPKHQVLWADIANSYGNHVIYAPAAHGKTTLFSILRSIWKITNDRFKRFILASATDTLSSEILSAIGYQFMNNDKLISDFGPFYSTECEWTNTSIRVLQADYSVSPAAWRPSGRKDPTLRAVGVGTSCLGKRCDELLGDDIINLKNSRTEELRRGIRYWWWNELEPTVDSGGQVIWVGNPVHRDDLSQELIRDGDYKFHCFKAILDENRKVVLWPEKRSYDWLSKRRERDPISFARRFQSIPVSDSDFVDWDKMSQNFRSDLKLKDFLSIQEAEKYKRLVLSVDPAFTKKRRSSYSAILCLGLTQENTVDLIGAWKGKVLSDELKRMIRMKALAYHVRETLVECNAQQWILVNELNHFPDIPKIIPCFTSSAKDDPEVGLASVIRLFDSKRVIVPYGDDHSRRMADDLCNEIAEYPEGEHDDLFMAFYQGVRNIVYVPLEGQIMGRKEVWRPKVGYKILGRNFSTKFAKPLSGFSGIVRR